MTPTPTPLITRRAWAAGAALAALGAWAPAGHALALGDAAPPLELQGTGGPVSLAALRGQVVLLDFWASWCPPCRLSLPWMDQVLARHAAAGLSVLAVNLDRQRSAADRFLHEVPTQTRLAYDPTGETPQRFGVRAMPTSFVIGRDGRIRLQHEGFREADREPLETALVAALRA